MSAFRPSCLPTAIGSMPQSTAGEAFSLIQRCLPEIPLWPQLPVRSPLENMYVQFFQGLPGARVEGGRLVIERGERFEAELETLYANYIAGSSDEYRPSPDVAAGFGEMLCRLGGHCDKRMRAIKGQVTGPISAGIQIADLDNRPILYDEVLVDALCKHISLVACEQERLLGQICSRTILFVDEPYLNAVGSAFIQVRREQVTQLLGEVLAGLTCLKGIHCCGNTDWSLVLSTPIDILSFDAYSLGESLALYHSDVAAFLTRGGVIAWGIVPTVEKSLREEDVDSLVVKLDEAVDRLVAKGLDKQDILAASLITPSCGLGSLTPAFAARALELTAGVSRILRGEVEKCDNEHDFAR